LDSEGFARGRGGGGWVLGSRRGLSGFRWEVDADEADRRGAGGAGGRLLLVPGPLSSVFNVRSSELVMLLPLAPRFRDGGGIGLAGDEGIARGVKFLRSRV
jgi:hypothetical protein